MKVELEHLQCRFGRNVVLEDISASVAPGEVTVILGPNASGKSTLMRCVAGLVSYRGHITLDGGDLSCLKVQERARLVGYVAQDTSQRAALTVFEIVLLGRIHSLRWSVPSHHLEAAWQALKDLGIENLAKQPIIARPGRPHHPSYIKQMVWPTGSQSRAPAQG